MAIAIAKPPAPAQPVWGGDLQDLGPINLMIFELAFSGAYVAGGEVVAPTFESRLKTVGAGNVQAVIFSPKLGYTFEYDYVNKKVLVRQDAAAGAPSAEIPVAAYPAPLVALAAGNRVRATVLGA